MKVNLKRALSVLLSVIMVLSIFTIIPFTASADWEDGAPLEIVGGYGVASSCTYYFDGAKQDSSSMTNLWDDSLQSYWGSGDWKKDSSNESDTTKWKWSLVVELPEVVTLKTLEVYFPEVADAQDSYGDPLYLKRITDVIVETSDTNNFSDTIPSPSDDENDIYHINGYKKDFSKENTENIKFIRITLADPKYASDEEYPDGDRLVQWWPVIGQLEIYVEKLDCEMKGIEDLQVRALYKSNKIEWTSRDSTSKYVIERKPFGADDSEYTVINGSIDAPTDITPIDGEDGKYYYTYLDTNSAGTPDASDSVVAGGITAQSKDNHTYRITKIEDGSDYSSSTGTQSRIAALEDRSVQALRRNALFSLDFGPYGKKFTGESGQVQKLADLTSNKVLIKKLQNLTAGTIGATVKLPEDSAGNQQIIYFNNSLYYRVENGNALRLKGNGGFTISYGTTKENVTSFAGSVWKNGHWTASKDGDVSGYPDQSASFQILDNSITEMWLGGTNTGGELFKGTLYDFIITAEPYTREDYMNIFRPSYSISLAEAIEEAEEHLVKYGTFASAESKELYQQAINAAKGAIEDLKEGISTENACLIHLTTLRAARTLLDRTGEYFSVEILEGPGVAEANMEHVVSPDRVESDDEVALDDEINNTIIFKSGNPHIMKFEAIPADKDLEFDGFYKGDQKLAGKEQCDIDEATGTVSYTLTPDQGISENATVEARFTGFNYGSDTKPSKSTLKKILDDADLLVLKENALSNSAQGVDNIDPAGAANSGSAGAAFDGLTAGTIWHQNWGAGYGSQALPTESAPIYIQSGLGAHNKRLIGGIGYVPKGGSSLTTIQNVISTFKVLVADDPEFTNPIEVASGNFVGMETTTSVDKTGEKSGYLEVFVPFEKPYAANYIRLVATGNNGVNGNYVAANEVFFYEFIGSETDGDVVLKDDSDNVLATVTAKGRQVAENGNINITEETAEQAVADASFEDAFNNIEYNYTIDVSDDTYDEATQTVTVTKTPATYDLTINDGGESHTEQDVAYGTNFEAYTAKGAGTFKYWKDSAENPVAIGKTFNFKATQNFEIEAVYDSEFADFDAYIPELIVSRKNTDWVVEVPVTLFNALDESGSIKSEVTDYGVVVVNPSVYGSGNEEALKSALVEGNNNMIKSSASGTELTNKGRYLHRLTIGGAFPDSGVYAYIVANGQVYLSNMQNLAAQSAL